MSGIEADMDEVRNKEFGMRSYKNV
jgi:hypothetical protein